MRIFDHRQFKVYDIELSGYFYLSPVEDDCVYKLYITIMFSTILVVEYKTGVFVYFCFIFETTF